MFHILHRSKLFFYMVALASLPVMLFSCKKEDAKFPYTNIVNFTVDANGQNVKAAVTGDSIILYFPVGQTIPENITPEIVVSDGATISPASGVSVSLKEAVVYNVTAQTGISKQYKLYVPANQPKPVISIFSGLNTYKGKTFLEIGNVFSFRGDYFDLAATATLINTSNQEKPTKNTHLNPIAWNVEPLEKGNYKQIILNSGGHRIVIDTTFEIIDDQYPRSTTFPAPVTVKRGADLTINGTNGFDRVTSVKFRLAGTDDMIETQVKSNTATSLIVTIPASFPIGNYDFLQLMYPENEYTGPGSEYMFLDESCYLIVSE